MTMWSSTPHGGLTGCPHDIGIGIGIGIGIDNITWESDYPHSDSNWPHSRKMAEEVFLNVPDDEVNKMVELNVRRLYNFPDTASAPS